MVEQDTRRISRKLGRVEYERLCEIYFIEAIGLDLIKVGYTLKVLERFRSMLTMSPCPLSLLGTISGGPQKEAELHATLEPHRSHGEWYRKAPAVMAVVATATPSGVEFLNRVAARRGEALQAYLAKMKAGEVVRPTRGPLKRPRVKVDRYAWSPEDPMRKATP